MNGNEHLRQTLEYYRQQRQKRLEELRPIDLMIRNLERELGEASSGVGNGAEEIAMPISEVIDNVRIVGAQPSVHADEFFGMSQSDAAKAYLKKVGRAVSLDQLLDGMKSGGAWVGGAEPKKTLYVSLMRNPLKEFVSPKEGFMGLREFYPNLPKAVKPSWGKKGKSGRKKNNGRRARSARGKQKAQAKSEVNAPKETGTKKTGETGEVSKARMDLKAVIRQVLSDGKSHPKKQVVKDVQEKVGHPIAEVAIYGAMRGKEFATSDEQVSLVQ